MIIETKLFELFFFNDDHFGCEIMTSNIVIVS